MNNKRKSSSNIIAKKCIVSAILLLIQEKPLSSINISELCDKAGVSRMTFYRNYSSKEDIFINHLSELFDIYKQEDISQYFGGIYCDRKHLEHFFDYVYEHKDFLDGLIMCGFDVIFLNMLTDYIIDKWHNSNNHYVLVAFSGSLFNMFHLWSSSNYSENKTLLIETLLELYPH